MRALKMKKLFGAVLLFQLLCSVPVTAQISYYHVHDDPDVLRPFGLELGYYFDSWSVNPNNGIKLSTLFRFRKVAQLDLGFHAAIREKVYNSERSGLTPFVKMDALFTVHLGGRKKQHHDNMTVNGVTYSDLAVTRKHAPCMRMGYSFTSTGYDRTVNTYYIDSLGGQFPVEYNMMTMGTFSLGLSYKGTQNTWVQIGGGKPVPKGHQVEVYADALVPGYIKLRDYSVSEKTYPVHMDEKTTGGWRMGFRGFTPIRSGVSFGFEFGRRPGPAVEKRGYISGYLAIWLSARGREGVY